MVLYSFWLVLLGLVYCVILGLIYSVIGVNHPSRGVSLGLDPRWYPLSSLVRAWRTVRAEGLSSKEKRGNDNPGCPPTTEVQSEGGWHGQPDRFVVNQPPWWYSRGWWWVSKICSPAHEKPTTSDRRPARRDMAAVSGITDS